MSTMIKVIAETQDTVTIDRSTFDRLIREASDANDRKAIAAYTERHDRLGPAEAHRLSYSAGEMARMVDDDTSPVTIWRERAGMSGRALAAKAAISPSYLAEIESGKKPGSVAAIKALADALNVPMEALVA